MADGTVTGQRFMVEICDDRWQPLNPLGEWTKLSYTEKCCALGSGRLDAPATPAARALLRDWRGLTILIHYNGETVSAGLITKVGETRANGRDVLNVWWKDQNDYLQRALAYPNPIPDPSTPNRADGQGPAEFDARAGYASTVVRGFFDANVGPGAGVPARRAPGMALTQDPAAGTYLDAPALARWDNLLEVMSGVALPNGVAFRFRTVDRVHYLEVYPVLDLTGVVLFADGLHNLLDGKWELTAPEATEVVLLGQGEGNARLTYLVTSPEGEAQAARWGRPFQLLLESSTKVVSKPEADAAKAEDDNHDGWVDTLKNSRSEMEKRYKALNRELYDLDLRLGDDYVGKTTQPQIDLERKTAIDACDAVGFQIDLLGKIDIDLVKDLSGEQVAAIAALAASRDGVPAAVDALHRVQNSYGKAWNDKQMYALDDAKRLFQELSDQITAFLTVRAQQLVYRQKALDYAAVSADANQVATYNAIVAEAKQLLLEKGETVSVEYEVPESGAFVYGRDFRLGDLVPVQAPGWSEPVLKPLRERKVSADASGSRKVTLTVGDYGAGGDTVGSVKTAELVKTVQRLQSRR